MNAINKDPINLIICGVGGQGNVLISRLFGQALVENDYKVTVGETYGAQQRGGSVASHIRISKDVLYGAIIPQGKADIVLSLEPMETLRILGQYGSSATYVISNTRPVHPMCVATGEAEYPKFEDIKLCINELSKKAVFIDASELALGLGASLLTNIIMAGALVGTNILPLKPNMFEHQLKINFNEEKFALNLRAFRMGITNIEKTF